MTERAALEQRLLKAAREATNGWACHARSGGEHKEISRLHTEIDELDALLRSRAEGETGCEWREDAEGVSQTACGHTFALDDSSGAAENGLRFCHFCGKRLAVAPTPGTPEAK